MRLCGAAIPFPRNGVIMSSNYKSIGNTAAAVLTVLATAGGLLWWQRASTAHPVPHPQDEAEIMTAILERTTAIGRPMQFTTTYGANVSQVLSNQVVGSVTNTITLYITNSPAHTDTNTIGYYPNAAYQYPSAIRSAIGNNWGCHWIVPSNTFFATGNWDGMPTGHGVINQRHGMCDNSSMFLEDDSNWWTNFVTCATGTFLTTSNYFCPQIVVTNVVGGVTTVSVITGDTNLLISTWINTGPVWYPEESGYWSNNSTTPCTFSTRQFTNAVTNGVDTGKLFAFERDRKAQYWSTNAYNDMSRALSLMQWQVQEGGNPQLTELYDSPFNSHETNIVLLQFFQDSSGPFTAIYTNDFEYLNHNADFYAFPYPKQHLWTEAFSLTILGEDSPGMANFQTDEGGSGSGQYLCLSIVFSFQQLHFTNSTPFFYTNCVWWPMLNYRALPPLGNPYWYGSTNVNSTIDEMVQINSRNKYRLFPDFVLPPHSSTNSPFLPLDPDITTADFISRGNAFMSAEWTRLSAGGAGSADESMLPQWGIVMDDYGPIVTYRVLFQTLTNYLNHAPMR